MDPLQPLFEQASLDLFTKREFVVAQGAPARLPEWMRSGLLANIEALCREHRGPLEIAHGGTGNPASTNIESFIGAGGQTPVQGAPAHALLRLGLTVYFGRLAGQVPAAKAFLTALEGALGLPACAGLSAFANAKGSGLPFHHDSFDQILIQLEGRKSFVRARRAPVAHPRISVSPFGPTPRHFETVYRGGFVEDDRAIEIDGVESHELSPGSCLFMPAGTWHRTAEQEENCLSLVIAVRAPSGLDLLCNAYRYLAGQSPAFRAPVYGLFPPTKSADGKSTPSAEQRRRTEMELRELSSRLQTEAGAISGQAMRLAWQESLINDGNADGYPKDMGFDWFIRLPGTSIRLETTDQAEDGSPQSRLTVRCPQSISDGVLKFSSAADVIVRAILKTDRAFSVAQLVSEFDEFEAEEVLAFVEQLAQVGLLRPLAMPPFE